MLKLGTIWKWAQSSDNNHQTECGVFHDSLEALELSPVMASDHLDILEQLPLGARQHAQACPFCMEAVEEFAAVRTLLRPLASGIAAPRPSPWFPSKVMNAIAARQAEETDPRESLWLNVKNLAPRLAAFCALLLVLSGTWALQVRREVQTRQSVRPAESLFEPTAAPPINDDVMASAGERR
jgi:hypothetical protein